MTDVSIIILTKNEQLHIKRCLERLLPLAPRQIFIVDCFSADDTKYIVRSFSNSNSELQLETPTKSPTLATNDQQLTTIHFVEHAWPGLQSVQFNWALDNLPIDSKWILRLDADEYLTPESIEWLKDNLAGIDEKVSALEFTLERKFMGRVIRHGTNGIPMVRMFRGGRGRYAETLMDERVVFEGEKLPVPVVFFDDNLNSLEWWKEKHRGYAKREAQQAIAGTFPDPRKAKYYKLPPYFRAFAYFCIRYFLKLGFLDGLPGFRWHFWQGLWYRWLVDKEISKIKKKMVVDVEKLENGDVILTNEGFSFVSLLVRIMTLSRYSHASLYAGGHVFDSTGDGVFDDDARRLVRYKQSQIAVYRFKDGLTQKETKNLEEFARNSVGKSYAVSDTLIIGVIKWFRTKEADTIKEYCSRFVAQAFKFIGKELVRNCNYCTPRALSRSKLLHRVRNCYRLRNVQDEIVLSMANRTLENRIHLESWLDEVKKIPLAQEEHVATENDAYEFVSRHREYDMPVARIIETSAFLDDYKNFFARYAFKLSPSGLYAHVGGDGYLQFLHDEIIDIQGGSRFIENLKVCELNYVRSRLEVMRLLRNLYYKLVYIIFIRLLVLEYVSKSQGIVELENVDLSTVVRMKNYTKAVLCGVSVDKAIFSQEELACLTEADGALQNS